MRKTSLTTILFAMLITIFRHVKAIQKTVAHQANLMIQINRLN